MKNKFFKKALSVFTAMAMALSLMTGIPFSELGLGIIVSAEESTITPVTPQLDSDGFYSIGSATELYGFAELVNSGNASANAKLTADIATTTVTVSEHAYNESEQSPTIIVKNGDTTLVQDTDYTVTGITSATDGGTYTVTLTGIGNYSGTKTVEWTIEKVTPQFGYTKSTPTYNGTAQQLLTVNLLSAGCVVEYSFDRTNWSTDIPTKTDAGTYRVYYRIIGTNNYSDYSGNNFNVTILKATPAINVTATPAQTSIGKAITVTATVFNHDNPSLTDTPTPELSYKIGSNDAVAFTGSFTIPAGTATGTNITITASTAESDNYFSATSPTTVTVIDCSHDGENTLEWDTDSHWYECEFCGATLNSTVHSGGAATCTDKAVCSTCNQEYGDVDPTNHAGTAAEWTTENGYHWHECACGEDLDKAACSGGTATCTDKAVCSICEKEYGNLDADNHIETVPEWSKDSTNHWYTCDCGSVISAAHTSSGAATDDTAEACTVCGYIITPALSHTTHTADTSKWYSDGTNHWHKCTGCEEKLDITAHSGGTATCTAKAVCSACKKEYGDVDPTNHAGAATEWTTENGYHWHECACGADLDKAACAGGTATCVAKAKCADCGTEYGTVDSNNHYNKAIEWTNDETGHWHICDCGKLDFAPHISSGAATANKADVCTVCNYEIAPALGYVSAPTFTPASGTTFTSSQKVTISCATAGAKIYYTTDGTEPTTASTLYNGAFTITTTTTIKAIAIKDGMTDSAVVTAKYTKNSGGSGGSGGGSGGGGGYRPPVVPDDDDDDNDDVVVNDPEDNEDKSDNGNEPQIKGDNGKTGWDAILDELDDADEGDKIVVDMNGETEVPEDVFEQIKGQDVDLVIELDNGFIWTINGKDVTNPADIDLGVNKGSTIPARVINAVTGECEYITITLTHNGEFGFKAVLTVDMGVKNEGYFANLYWYTDNDTKFICADKIDNKGRANLVFTHASEYVIVIDENDHTPEDDVSAGAGIEEDSSEIPDDFDNDENPYTGVAISFAGIIISAATIMIARKRKKQ